MRGGVYTGGRSGARGGRNDRSSRRLRPFRQPRLGHGVAGRTAQRRRPSGRPDVRSGRQARQAPRHSSAGATDSLRHAPQGSCPDGGLLAAAVHRRLAGPDRPGARGHRPWVRGGRRQSEHLVPAAGRQRPVPGAGDRRPLLFRHPHGRARHRRCAKGPVRPHPDAGPVLLRPYAHRRGAVAPDHGHRPGRDVDDDVDFLRAQKLPDPDRRRGPAVLRQPQTDWLRPADRALPAGADFHLRPQGAQTDRRVPGPLRQRRRLRRRKRGRHRDGPGLWPRTERHHPLRRGGRGRLQRLPDPDAGPRLDDRPDHRCHVRRRDPGAVAGRPGRGEGRHDARRPASVRPAVGLRGGRRGRARGKLGRRAKGRRRHGADRGADARRRRYRSAASGHGPADAPARRGVDVCRGLRLSGPPRPSGLEGLQPDRTPR